MNPKQAFFILCAITILLSGCGTIATDLSSSAPNGMNTTSPDIEKGLVEVMVTYQEFSAFLPWQKKQPHTRSGYGVAVDDTTVITMEKLVRNQELVELRKARTGEKIRARVLISDIQSGMALLKIQDSVQEGWLHPVKLIDKLPQKAKVKIYQLDETAQIQKGDADVLSISVSPLPLSPHNTLTFKLLSNMNINADGAMVTYKGKLAGIVSHYNSSSRTATMLPYTVIDHFLADAAHKPYKGFASAGFFWTTLVDPAKRSYLGVHEQNKGILVLSVPPSTGNAEGLKPNDVILKWDGYSIDNMGYYDDEKFGRLAFPYLIRGKRAPGDVVPVTIIRDRASMTVKVTLHHRTDSDALIPDNITGQQPEYLIEGGLFIRELTGKYLMAHGSRWRRAAGSNIAQIYMTRKHMPSRKGERVVVLAGVLSDPVNIGYQNFRNHIITHLNDTPVWNMDDVFRIRERDKLITRIRLQFVGVELILDAKLLPEANERLATLYRVPSLSFRRKK